MTAVGYLLVHRHGLYQGVERQLSLTTLNVREWRRRVQVERNLALGEG